jgi:hypothetical protein
VKGLSRERLSCITERGVSFDEWEGIARCQTAPHPLSLSLPVTQAHTQAHRHRHTPPSHSLLPPCHATRVRVSSSSQHPDLTCPSDHIIPRLVGVWGTSIGTDMLTCETTQPPHHTTGSEQGDAALCLGLRPKDHQQLLHSVRIYGRLGCNYTTVVYETRADKGCDMAVEKRWHTAVTRWEKLSH